MYIIVVLLSCVLSAILFVKLRSTRKKLSTAEDLLKTIEHTNDFFFHAQMYPSVKYKYLSPGFYTFFGEERVRDHIRNPIETYLSCIHPDDVHIVLKKIDGTANYDKPFLFRIRTQKGTYHWFEEYATPVFEGDQLVALHGIYRDVNTRIILQKELEHKAMHDQLTNVKNRTFFEDQLTRLNEEKDIACGVIICDLDNLKTLNDNSGHKVGDTYIQRSAQLLTKAIGEDGHICRIGGDEFAIVFEQLSREQLQTYVQTIEDVVSAYNKHADIAIHMSLGYSFTTCSYKAMDDVFKEADAAMYAQKIARKNRQ